MVGIYVLIGYFLVNQFDVSSAAFKSSRGKHVGSRSMIGCGKVDVIFLLDQSNSITMDDMERGKQFISDVIGTLQIGRAKTRVGLLSFAGRAEERFRLDRFFTMKQLQREVLKLQRLNAPSTKTHEGLRMLRVKFKSKQFGSRQKVAKIAILITDGASSEPDKTIREAKLLHKTGAAVFTIGVGKDRGQLNKTELQIIATDPDEKFVYLVDDWSALHKIHTILEQRSCLEPAAAMPTPKLKDKYVKVKDGSSSCDCKCPSQDDNGYGRNRIDKVSPLQKTTTGPDSAIPNSELNEVFTARVFAALLCPRDNGYLGNGRDPNDKGPHLPQTTSKLASGITNSELNKILTVRECKQTDIIFVPPDSASPVQLNSVGLFVQEVTKALVHPVTTFRIGVLPYICRQWNGIRLRDFRNKFQTVKHMNSWSFDVSNVKKLLIDMRMNFKSDSDTIYKNIKRNNNRLDPRKKQVMRKVAVVILDRSSDDIAATIDEARSAQEEGVEIYVIAVGRALNLAEARSISSLPSKNYFITVDSYKELSTLVPKLTEKLTDCIDIAFGYMC